MSKKKKRRKSMSRFIVPFVILSIFIFTGLAIYLQFETSVELSSTLIVSFYGFCTGELWLLASIKKTKIIQDADGDGIPDDIDPEIDVPVEEVPYNSNDNYNQGVEDALSKIRELLEEGGIKND